VTSEWAHVSFSVHKAGYRRMSKSVIQDVEPPIANDRLLEAHLKIGHQPNN